MTDRGPGRFTTGSTMRHVAVMTAAGSAGLFFLFIVDFATLFFVSLLGEDALTAGVGFAWAIQFVTASVGIGLSIAAMALVSRSIGAGERRRARSEATSAIIITVCVLTVTAVTVIAFRRPLCALIGAEGEAAEVAARFLMISVSSLPFVGMSMVSASILRAEGDARRSMLVTMTGGAVALALAPPLMFQFGMGVDGAALAMVLSRAVSSLTGVRFCLGRGLLAPPSLIDARRMARPYFVIAGPAVATQLSTPMGNLLFTWWISDFGDSAVAGWAVASRLTVLSFGGIFALSGAIGGILGQNYGARLSERVAKTYRDSLIFASCYVVTVWALLASFAPVIVRGFGVSDAGASVIYAFCYIGAGGFMFNGGLFVANAAFNNLGRPLWSTAFNWTRDGIVTPLALISVPVALGAPGVVYAQAVAGVLAGGAAVVSGWRFTRSIRFPAPAAETDWPAGPQPIGSARAAMAMMDARRGDSAPLAKPDALD